MSVGEDGGVVALEGLVDEVVDVGLLVELFLGDGVVEDVVEVKVFAGVVIEEFYFFAGGVYVDVGIVVAVFGFGFEEGTNANGCFDFAGHNKIIQ